MGWSDSINVPYYSGFKGHDMIAEFITPESDYKIENLAYSNEEIVFTAKRGNERALFKMSYSNREPGEPKLVQTIDDSWGNMLFWKDEDIPVTIGYYTEKDSVPNKDYKIIDNFKLEGTWCNIGNGTFGQIDKASVVVFDGSHCNVYSPGDTYAFYSEGDHYTLQVTGLLGGDHTFSVYTVDKDHMDLINGSNLIELERVE